MPAENQPDSPTDRYQSTGRWLVLVAALRCLGPTGCHSYRALPDAAPAELHGPTLAQRDVEAIADEYLSALLEYAPELGTMYSLPGARHDRLTDHSPEARAAWQAREDAWLAELDARGMPAEVGSRDWVTWGILHETLAGAAGIGVAGGIVAAGEAGGWAAGALAGVFVLAGAAGVMTMLTATRISRHAAAFRAHEPGGGAPQVVEAVP